jgi:hypothetical protein
MFIDALPSATRKCLALLNNSPLLAPFYLAGGTAIALHLGHRLSVDLDFFGPDPFDPAWLATQLGALGQFQLEQVAPNTVLGTLEGTKVAFFCYPYPLLTALTKAGATAVADLPDLAAMKLAAIAQRGARRDFIDLYFLAQHGVSPATGVDLYRRKYTAASANLVHVAKSLAYFEDAERDPMPQMMRPVDWPVVKAFFSAQSLRLLEQLSAP